MKNGAYATALVGLILLILSGDPVPEVAAQQPQANPLPGTRLSWKSKPGVWFATHEQVASYVRSGG